MWAEHVGIFSPRQGQGAQLLSCNSVGIQVDNIQRFRTSAEHDSAVGWTTATSCLVDQFAREKNPQLCKWIRNVRIVVTRQKFSFSLFLHPQTVKTTKQGNCLLSQVFWTVWEWVNQLYSDNCFVQPPRCVWAPTVWDVHRDVDEAFFCRWICSQAQTRSSFVTFLPFRDIHRVRASGLWQWFMRNTNIISESGRKSCK